MSAYTQRIATEYKPVIIAYLRSGRTKRGSGRIIETDTRTGMFKVLPSHAGWKAIWITVDELQQGGTTAPAPAPAPTNHIPSVRKMVDGLRELLIKKDANCDFSPETHQK